MAAVYPTPDFEETQHMKYGDDDAMAMNNVSPHNSRDLPQLFSFREAEEAPEITQELSIFQCARNGYFEQIKKIVENKLEDVNSTDDENLTPLHFAARYNHYDIVKLLLEHSADANARDDDGLTPLHYACRIKRKRKKGKKSKHNLYGDPNAEEAELPHSSERPVNSIVSVSPFKSKEKSVIKAIADKDPNSLRKKDGYGLTALHHAALRGDEVACEILLSLDDQLVHTKDIQWMTPLHTAACQGESDIARQLILKGASVFERDEEMSTPLHETATVGDTKTAKIIFDACKGDVSQIACLLKDADEDGNTALMLAVESGKYKFAVLCIKRGASVNTKNKAQMTALHLAAINGDIRIVKLLLENNANVSLLNSEHQTPLHKAALFNNTDAIDVLLQRGADIEWRDKDDFTPLLIAACYGHQKAFELLINKGADITVKDKNDRTAIHLAAEENKLQALQVLLKYPKAKSMINDKDENSNSALHGAATLGHVSVVKCLLDNGADLYSKNDMEATPIHSAAQNGWTNVVKEIVRLEKNTMSIGDEQSNTALHLAATGGHTKLVETLLNLGAGTRVRNSTLRTPLGCAAHAGFIKTVKILAAHDTEIDPVDKQKMTPLLLAAENGHAEVVDFLIEKNANVSSRNMSGRNCLELAINNDHIEVASEIIKSKSWEIALRNSEKIDKHRVDTPLRKLIRKMPDKLEEFADDNFKFDENGTKVLQRVENSFGKGEIPCNFMPTFRWVAEKVFDKCITVNKPYEVTYNFEFLDDLYQILGWARESKQRKKGKSSGYTDESEVFKMNHPFMIMVNFSREQLLTHPLVTALVKYKWERFGGVFYYVTFCSYLYFLAFLTGYVITTDPPYEINSDRISVFEGSTECEKYVNSGAKQHPFAAVAKFFILILAFLNIIKEGFQAYHGRFAYLSTENFIECCLYVSSILFTLDFESCQSESGYRTDWQWHFGTIAVFLAWIVLILFIQKFPTLGIYVVMFKYILYTFLKFALVFLLFIIAFGMGFYCLIQNQTPYRNVWLAIIRTAVMMVGEFDYNDIFHGDDEVHYWLTYVFMCVFVVLMSIIIMNLLVGLAVDDIKGVQEQAQLKRIAMNVSLILDIERFSLDFTNQFYKDEHSVYFDKAEDAEEEVNPKKEIDSQIKASQEIVLKRVDKIKNTVKSVKKDMVKLEEMLEAIMSAQDIKID